MSLINAIDLTKAYTEENLFSDLNFSIEKGQKIALIAPNGAGKTTLLKLLLGFDDMYKGEIVRDPNVFTAYLPQEANFSGFETLWDYIYASEGRRMTVYMEHKKLIDDGATIPSDLKALMASLSLWTLEDEVAELVSRFKLPDVPLSFYSGGQLKRLMILKMMVEQPEFVVLDEPTNHLDTEMLEYLEEFLCNKRLTVLMISHDRYFLDKIVNLVFELDKGALHIYKGDYSNFVERKRERVLFENNEVSRARSMLKKEKEWMQRGVKARETKSKDRMERYYELEERAEKKMEKVLEFAAMETPRIGGKILEIKNLHLAYGDNVLIKEFDYNFPQGQRVGIVGPNGVGKTSLLRLLIKEEFPDVGHVMHGKTISFGYFKQHQEEFDEDMKVIDVVREHGSEYLEMQKGTMSLSKLLEMFLFTPRMQHSLVKFLSGGQRRRLTLLTVLVKNPNFLILDEPTNDLDIMSLHALEDFLDSYAGCVLFVSHDRYFVDKIAEKLFVFEGDGVVSQFEGSYSEYKQGVPPLIEKVEVIKDPAKKSNKEIREEAKKRDKIMRKLEKLESRKAEILNEFSVPMSNSATAQLSNEIDEIIKEIELLEEKWMGLDV